MIQQQVITKEPSGIWMTRPYLDIDLIQQIAKECFGFIVEKDSFTELVSYYDRNYFVKGTFMNTDDNEQKKYILKVSNSCQSAYVDWYDNYHKMLCKINTTPNKYIQVPQGVPDITNGRRCLLYKIPLLKDVVFQNCSSEDFHKEAFVSTCENETLVQHIIQFIEYIPGKTLDVNNMNENLAKSYGIKVGMLLKHLQDFPAPVVDIRENFEWNTLAASKLLVDPYITSIKDERTKKQCMDIFNNYDTYVKPRLSQLTKQWVHSDLNDQNMIMKNNEVIGIIDWDHTHYSYRACDIAVLFMYLTCMSTKENCLKNVRNVFKGIATVLKLNEIELDVIYEMMLVRYVTSYTIGLYRWTYVEPTNEIVKRTAEHGQEKMNFMVQLGKEEFKKLLVS